MAELGADDRDDREERVSQRMFEHDRRLAAVIPFKGPQNEVLAFLPLDDLERAGARRRRLKLPSAVKDAGENIAEWKFDIVCGSAGRG